LESSGGRAWQISNILDEEKHWETTDSALKAKLSNEEEYILEVVDIKAKTKLLQKQKIKNRIHQKNGIIIFLAMAAHVA
jgi:hypothetical protein